MLADDPILFYHLSNIRDLIEYGVSHLIVRKSTSFTKVFYDFKMSDFPTFEDLHYDSKYLTVSTKELQCLGSRPLGEPNIFHKSFREYLSPSLPIAFMVIALNFMISYISFLFKIYYSTRNCFNDQSLLSEVSLGLVAFNPVRWFDVT